MHTLWKRLAAAVLIIIILGTSFLWNHSLWALEAEDAKEPPKEMEEHAEESDSEPESGQMGDRESEPANEPVPQQGGVVRGVMMIRRPDYTWSEMRSHMMRRESDWRMELAELDAACRDALLAIMEEYDQVLPVEEMQEVMKEACGKGLISREMFACWENVFEDYCEGKIVGDVESFYENLLHDAD